MTVNELREQIRARVGNEFRFAHILGVEEECVRLAGFFGMSEEETHCLRVAGLLHDLTKQLKTPEQKALYEKYGIPFGETEENSPKTLHAVTGAYLARELYPEFVNDTVFSSILTHTTGAEEMSLSQKLVYLADYIEPGRTYESCTRLRRLFYENPEGLEKEALLKKVLLLSFDQTLSELIEENAYIHPLTVAARNRILRE